MGTASSARFGGCRGLPTVGPLASPTGWRVLGPRRRRGRQRGHGQLFALLQTDLPDAIHLVRPDARLLHLWSDCKRERGCSVMSVSAQEDQQQPADDVDNQSPLERFQALTQRLPHIPKQRSAARASAPCRFRSSGPGALHLGPGGAIPKRSNELLRRATSWSTWALRRRSSPPASFTRALERGAGAV